MFSPAGDMIKTILKTFVLLGTALVLFIYVAWINLSSLKLTNWLNYQGNKQLSGNFDLKVKGAKPVWGGIEVQSVVIKNKKNKVDVLFLSRSVASFGWTNILLFQSVPFKTALYNGSATGELDLLSMKVKIKLDRVSVNYNPLLRKTNILDSNPILSAVGEVNLRTPLRGELQFQLKNIKLNGDSKTSGLIISFPNMDLSMVKGQVNVNNQAVQLSLNSQGDITAQIEGNVKLNLRRPMRSHLNLKVLANIQDGYKKKLDFIEPLLTPYTRSNGQIAVKVNGAVSFPQIKKF